MQNTISVLAVSGSLRSHSSNTFILKAMAAMAPENVHFFMYDGIGNLPHFNPDIEHEMLPAVADWRNHVKQADGVIFCTPEYAYNIPGVLKNALDWLVGSGELNRKPVAAISASPAVTGGEKAMLSLENTLTALDTIKSPKTILQIGAVSKKINAEGLLTDEVTKQQLSDVLSALVEAINSSRKKERQ